MNSMRRTGLVALLAMSFALPLRGEAMLAKESDLKNISFDVQDLAARAKKGDGEAYYQLGIMFLCGHQVPRNHFIAHDYLRKSHELGYGYASVLLGMSHEFGGLFVEKGVALCEELPYRALIMEYRPRAAWGLDLGRRTAQEYYAMALTNGVRHARVCLDRMERATAKEKRRTQEAQLRRERVLAGDCRTAEEREAYEKHKALQEKHKREQAEFRERLRREEEEREQAKRLRLETQISDLKKRQQARLAAADSGIDSGEHYWAACFLRAWAATASNEEPELRVELARRSMAFLERAAAGGLAQAEFDLGRMLVGGDVGTIGPRPVHRGGFLEGLTENPAASTEWVPEDIEVVKQGDVKGPCFAPYVLVLKVSEDKTLTNQIPVLVYKQDVRRGMELLRRAAAKKHEGAVNWFKERRKAGLPEDAPPWVLATDAFHRPTSNPVLKFRSYERATDYLGWIYREMSIDSVTGDVVGRSEEFPERKATSPWNLAPRR